ncbi:heat shock transcription factor, Y-linked-like isoform X2 [Tamandua tetradactyla]|uniref:heat shock transcription factor, Y-linked-like isoform X2 n=1 Tax=Tamandua tetradactyla TaxID=48850 RepID=UPI004053988D
MQVRIAAEEKLFKMEHVSSETQDVSSEDGPTGSEASIRSPLSDHTCTRDSDLRSMIEESAFQALLEVSLIKRPRYTFCVSKPDEDDDFLSLTFPRKLWKIVESDQFKSIWWDENGTSILINEELFKKEVLGRQAPFRIFETDSMKSLIRQLNLYGFSKMRLSFQRSASPADFLAEEKEGSVLNKVNTSTILTIPTLS